MVDWGDVPTWLAVFGAFLAAGAALWQLRLQRIQLTDQTRVQEREQANLIDVSAQAMTITDDTVLPGFDVKQADLVRVANGSKRPIRDVAARISVAVDIGGPNVLLHPVPAEIYGEMKTYALGSTARADQFVFGAQASEMPVLRAGHTAAFVWGQRPDSVPGLKLWVRFRDDAGLSWEVTTDLHLSKLDKRDW